MKVLIVAMPKSASTSLQKLLCEKNFCRNANFEVRERAFSYFFAATRFRDWFRKSNPLFFWHSDLFYGGEAIVNAIQHTGGEFIVKLHIGDLESKQLVQLKNCVDKIIYCRRDVHDVVAAYDRGSASGVYPNLFGKRLKGSSTREAIEFLRKLDEYWKYAADEVVEFEKLTNDSYFDISGCRYNSKDLPKERFSRQGQVKRKLFSGRVLMLFIESILRFTPINGLFLRRYILGLLKKY